jgi:hypothetical protein
MAEKAEIEVFRTLLGIVGVGLGVVTVIAAFASPSFEGRVYFFLPAIIFGVIGMLVGTVIDKIATAIRDQLGSRPPPSSFSPPPRGSQHAQGSSRSRFCAQCGVGLSVSAKFCGSCGYKVGR